jgi:hypothetical protein
MDCLQLDESETAVGQTFARLRVRGPADGSTRATPAAGAKMLIRPSSQRTRSLCGCSLRTSSIKPARPDRPARSDSILILSPTWTVTTASLRAPPLDADATTEDTHLASGNNPTPDPAS